MSAMTNPTFNLDEYIIAKAQALVRSIDHSDLALISAREPKAAPLKPSMGVGKVRGGSPPVDYTGVEELVDLRAELAEKEPNIKILASSYMRLRSLLGSDLN